MRVTIVILDTLDNHDNQWFSADGCERVLPRGAALAAYSSLVIVLNEHGKMAL